MNEHDYKISTGIYPITLEELDAAQAALDHAISECASLTSCVHAVLGAIKQVREAQLARETT